MIISRLQGGLGNQFFQYAAGRALARRKNTSLYLDVSLLGRKSDQLTPRQFELGAYSLPYMLVDTKLASKLNLQTGTSLMQRIKTHLRKTPILHYHEPHFQFDPHFFELPEPVILEGYWQSYHYFSEIENELRDALRNHLKPSPHAQSVYADMIGSQSISLHVRRGDYVSRASTASYHGVCSLSYYQRAIEVVCKRFTHPVFFVFSDDPAWVSRHLNIPGESFLVSSIPDMTHYDEIFLMTQCKAHIIANSSYSWWGAWLNPAPDKMVIAPTPWFRNNPAAGKDLIPQNWVTLSSDGNLSQAELFQQTG